MDSINKFLEKKHKNGKAITHFTSGITVDTPWSLSNNACIKLMNKYNELYLDEDMYVIENNISTMPIIIDLELKFDKKKNFVMPFDLDLICCIVGCCQEIIKNMFGIDDVESKLLYCHYLKYNKVVKGPDYIMQKCRLFFPYFRCNIEEVYEPFKNSLLKMLRTYNAMKYFSAQPINSWDNIIDFDVSRKPLTLYGGEDFNKRKLIFDRIITFIDVEDFDESYNNLDIIEIDEYTFDPYEFSLLEKEEDEELVVDDDNLINYLPILYSIHYSKTILSVVNNKKDKVQEVRQDNNILDDEDENIVILKTLLPMLSKKRFKEKNYIMKVATAIYNVYEESYTSRNSPEAYKLFKSYLSKYNDKAKLKKFGKEMFEGLYRFHNTIRTIAVYAYEDNPKQYKEWFNKWCNDAVNASLCSCTKGAVAEAFYRHYWLEFITTDGNSDKYVCYYYRTPLWEEDFKTHTIEHKIDKEFKNIYKRKVAEIEEKIRTSDDEGHIKILTLCKRKIDKIINGFGEVPYVASLCSFLKKKFFVRGFMDKINTNDKLTAVRNGVIEIVGKDVIFRKGEYDDYLTVGFNAMFNKNMSFAHENVKSLLSWFEKLYHDRETFLYMNRFNSSLLSPETLTLNKLFTIIDGTGDQGKSVLGKQYKATMGKMFKKMAGEYLVCKRNTSANASPDIISMAYSRLIWFQEINPLSIFIANVIKELTGGDDINGRQMFKDKYKDTVITGKVVVATNKIARFDMIDTAIKNRFTRIHIEAKFNKYASSDPKVQAQQKVYPVCKKMGKKVIDNADALLWLMFTNYKHYAKEGLEPSAYIEKYTAKYWELNDTYEKFIKECIKITDKESDKLSFKDIYNKFNDWYSEYFPKRMVPDSSFVRHELEEKWGEPNKNNKWTGKKFRGKKILDDFNK